MYFCIKSSQTTVMRVKLSVPGGSVQTKAYDPLMRPTRIKVNNPSQSTLMDYQYTYDAESNITQKATEHGSYDYQYDDLYRLSTVSNPWGMSNEAWTYDALGNRKTDKQRGGSNEWQVNANNQLTKTYTENNTEVNPVWDDNGSLIKHQTTDSAPELNQTYVYDAQNRLIEVRAKDNTDNQSLAHYQYDPFGRRIVKTVKSTQENTTYFVYSDDGLIAEANANGAMTTEYGWQPVQTGNPWSTDPLFITTTRAGSTEPETFAYQNDHLGTPQKIIDSQGQIVWAAKATAFGETEVSANSTIINNLRFPGQYFDAETKTHYNYFRDYNPATGTYRQADPIGLNGGINVYAYVEGNPLMFVDPEGLKVNLGAPNATDMQKLRSMYDSIKKTERGGKLLGDMEKSEKDYTIMATRSPNVFNYDPRNRTITISLSETKWQICTKDGWKYITAIRALAHEIGHPVTEDEDKNVWLNENPIVRELGLPERTGYEPKRYKVFNWFDLFGSAEGGKCGC